MCTTKEEGQSKKKKSKTLIILFTVKWMALHESKQTN